MGNGALPHGPSDRAHPRLYRPGGNITGVSLMASALAGKSIELFRDMLPSVRRVGVLGHATNPVFAKAMLDEVLLAGAHELPPYFEE